MKRCGIVLSVRAIKRLLAGSAIRIQGSSYYPIGTILWVKEPWRVGAWNEDTGSIAVDYKIDGYCRREWLLVPEDSQFDSEPFNTLWEESCIDAHAAEMQMDENGKYHWRPGESPCRWRSALSMPHWASRITLKVGAIDEIKIGSSIRWRYTLVIDEQAKAEETRP